MTARNLARAGVVVFGSRVLGWVRLVVVGNLFGAGSELDAYFSAFRIPDLIYQLVAAGAISSALVPVLAGLLHDGENERADKVISTVINTMLLVLVAFSITMAVFAPQIVPFLVPGFDSVTTELTIRLTRIMLIAPILLALGAVAGSVLNMHGRFAAAAIAPMLYNVAIIGCAIFLSPMLGIDSLAVGVVLGAFLHIAVQLRPLRQWLHYDLVLDLTDKAARRILNLLIPRALGLGAGQIVFIVNTTLATVVAVGAVTMYNIAFTIFVIPLGIIGLPLGVLMLPAMSRAMAAGELRSFGSLLVGSVRLLVFVSLFLSIVGMVISRQVVGLLFGYGAFDPASLDLTAQTLAVLLASMTADALCLMLARAFFTAQDTKTPLVGVLLCVVVSVTVSIATVSFLGLLGLALGVVLGDWSEALFLIIMLRRKLPTLELFGLLRVIPVLALGGVIAGGAAYVVVHVIETYVGTDPGKLALLFEIVAASTVGGALYLLYARLVRLPELPRAFGLVASLFHRDGSDAN